MLNAKTLVSQTLSRLQSPTPDIIIPDPPDIVAWGEDRFYITETRRPIVLQPVQRAVLREFFRRDKEGRFVYRRGLYSTIKKSGKTTVAALVQQWACQTWGDYGEIFHMGNKLKQAQERAFKLTRYSIELSPYSRDWDITATRLHYLPTRSFIQALPVNAAGEAGGNQRLTTWTELYGYIHESDERMFSELQPVPTQPLSFQFMESYAGYEGESVLLWNIWQRLLTQGERIHDEYPIYAILDEGLVGYLDTGIVARRMPWQTDQYYTEEEANELPHEYRRLHFNEWATSQSAFIQMALWDRLETSRPAISEKPSVVIACDASVSGDCTALVVVAPRWEQRDNNLILIVQALEVYIWQPEHNEKLDYSQTIEPALHDVFSRYKVIGVAYDPYQLHDLMTRAKHYYHRNDDEFFFAVEQGKSRLIADTALLNRIRQGTIEHYGDDGLTQHVRNADAKTSDDRRIRLVKRSPTEHIDAVVALGMGAWRLSELIDSPPKRRTARVSRKVSMRRRS